MHCDQALITYPGGTPTCATPGCLDGLTVAEAVMKHDPAISCLAVFGTGCPECRRTGRQGGPPSFLPRYELAVPPMS